MYVTERLYSTSGLFCLLIVRTYGKSISGPTTGPDRNVPIRDILKRGDFATEVQGPTTHSCLGDGEVLRYSLYKCPTAEVKMESRRMVGTNTPSDSNQLAVTAHAECTMQHWAYVTSGTVSSRVVTTCDAILPK